MWQGVKVNLITHIWKDSNALNLQIIYYKKLQSFFVVLPSCPFIHPSAKMVCRMAIGAHWEVGGFKVTLKIHAPTQNHNFGLDVSRTLSGVLCQNDVLIQRNFLTAYPHTKKNCAPERYTKHLTTNNSGKWQYYG